MQFGRAQLVTAWNMSTRSMGLGVLRTEERSEVVYPWTVTRDVWQVALRPDVSGIAVDARLFHEAGCRLVHKYRVYKDPFPHPALREWVIPRLLSFVAQRTQLHISIPASGVPSGQVPTECFLGGTSARELMSPQRVSFASDVTVLGGAPLPMHSPDIVIYEPSSVEVIEEDVMVTEDMTTDMSAPIVPHPPGFRQFSWPRDDWQVGGDSSLFTVDEELPGWSPWSSGGGGGCWLICHYCRCRLSFWIARTILSLLRWDRPGRSQALRLKLSWPHHRWGTLQRR